MRFIDLVRGTTKSKTMKFGGVMGLIWGLFQSGAVDMEAVNVFLQKLFGGNPEVMSLISAVSIIGTFFFRAVTTKPLAERAKD